MTWLAESWHKLLITLLTVDRLYERGVQIWEKFRPIGEFVERRKHREVKVNPEEIVKALQIAPTLLPQLVQILTDANKVLADFSALMEQLKSVSATGAAPVPAAPPASPGA